MKIILVTLIALSSQFAFSGEKGNGGDGLVCRSKDGKLQTMRFLDLVEGDKEFKIHPNVSKLPLKEFVSRVSKNLTQCDPTIYRGTTKDALDLAGALTAHRKSGTSKAGPVTFVSEVLSDVEDSKHEETFGKGCRVEQVIVRSETVVPTRYKASSELIRALSEDDLKALVLHEVIYLARDRAMNEPNSFVTRKLVRKVMAIDPEFLDEKNICEL
jgi:hypothetical protein